MNGDCRKQPKQAILSSSSGSRKLLFSRLSLRDRHWEASAYNQAPRRSAARYSVVGSVSEPLGVDHRALGEWSPFWQPFGHRPREVAPVQRIGPGRRRPAAEPDVTGVYRGNVTESTSCSCRKQIGRGLAPRSIAPSAGLSGRDGTSTVLEALVLLRHCF
jgi:hypothetical protein